MVKLVFRVISNAIALYIASLLIHGIVFDGSMITLLLTGAVLGLANAIIKPIVMFLSLPLILITFGTVIILINVAILLLASAVVPGFEITGFIPALLAVLVISAVNIVLSSLFDFEK